MLDAIDLRILEALQRDGRMSNVDPGDPGPPVGAAVLPPRARAGGTRRAARLPRRCRPLALGLSVTAYVSLNITAQAFVRVREIESLIRDFPEILECHTVSGDSDYLLKVVARDLQALSKFLTDKLMQLDGVADVRSMICLEEIKPPAGLPVK